MNWLSISWVYALLSDGFFHQSSVRFSDNHKTGEAVAFIAVVGTANEYFSSGPSFWAEFLHRTIIIGQDSRSVDGEGCCFGVIMAVQIPSFVCSSCSWPLASYRIVTWLRSGR